MFQFLPNFSDLFQLDPNLIVDYSEIFLTIPEGILLNFVTILHKVQQEQKSRFKDRSLRYIAVKKMSRYVKVSICHKMSG